MDKEREKRLKPYLGKVWTQGGRPCDGFRHWWGGDDEWVNKGTREDSGYDFMEGVKSLPTVVEMRKMSQNRLIEVVRAHSALVMAVSGHNAMVAMRLEEELANTLDTRLVQILREAGAR